eukprot:448695_1
MLSGVYDELHDIIVIAISIGNQALNIAVTYLLYAHGWTSYYIASLIFVFITIISQSAVFTARFVPCYRVRKQCKYYIKPFCHIILYFIIGALMAPLTSLIIYITERYLRQGQIYPSSSFNQRKCVRVHGCVYIQRHESVLNQWMHYKFAKHFAFLAQLITDTVPHLIIQLIFLMNKVSKSKLSELENTGVLLALDIAIIVGILSIMTKTFIFGYGFDNKIYIFSWMCYITDILHILFIILFIFYTEHPVSLTYLHIPTADTILAKTFMYVLSYVIIPLTAGIGFVASAYMSMDALYDFYWDWYFYMLCCVCILVAWLCIGSVIWVISVLFLTFLNVSVVSRWTYNKQRRFKYITKLDVAEIVTYINAFVNKKSMKKEMELYSYPENDRVIRILSVNSAYHAIRFADPTRPLDTSDDMVKMTGDDRLLKFIQDIEEKHSWNDVTERSILAAVRYVYHNRKYIVERFKYKFLNEYANFVVATYRPLLESWKNADLFDYYPILAYTCCSLPFFVAFILITICQIWLFLYGCSRLLIVFYPIIALISALTDVDNQYLGTHWIVLVLFVGCYIGICVLGFTHIVPIFDTLDLIRPGDLKVNLTLNNNNKESFRRQVNYCYGIVQLSKYIQEMLIKKFGDDVARIIVDFAFDEWMAKK